MVFTRNGRWLLVADYDHSVFAVDLEDGERQLRVEFHSGPVEGVSALGDAGFASWSRDRTVLFFQELTAKVLRDALVAARQMPR